MVLNRQYAIDQRRGFASDELGGVPKWRGYKKEPTGRVPYPIGDAAAAETATLADHLRRVIAVDPFPCRRGCARCGQFWQTRARRFSIAPTIPLGPCLGALLTGPVLYTYHAGDELRANMLTIEFEREKDGRLGLAKCWNCPGSWLTD